VIATILAACLAVAPAAAPPEQSGAGGAVTAARADPADRLEAANTRYLAGDFAAAADGYGALVAEGWESETLHLNRGNALLRLGHRGPAIASFERALRLAPGDEDVRANLALARATNVDRILGAEERSFAARVVARVPDGGATALFLAAWLALWTALVLRRRAAGRARAPLAAAAIAAALLAVVAGALLAGKAAERRTASAIVVTEVAPVREGPSSTLRAAFELHEGTRVRVLEATEGMARIRLENGLEGWILRGDIEAI
jgi:tetratricopeptide (TPR) repeat protein